MGFLGHGEVGLGVDRLRCRFTVWIRCFASGYLGKYSMSLIIYASKYKREH